MKKLWGNRLKSLSILLITLCNITVVQAAPAYNPNASPSDMAAILDGPGLSVSNLSITRGVTQQYGVFTQGGSVWGTDTGVFLNTGNLGSIQAPNSGSAYSHNTKGQYLDPDLSRISAKAKYDPVLMEFDINPQGDRVNFVFAFGSDEYPEYVCSSFNDAFGLFVSGPGLNGVRNAAFVPGTGDAIAVNNVNAGSPGINADGAACNLNNATYFVNNGNSSAATQLDGYTRPMTASLEGLIPGQTYHVKLALADAGDPAYDSGAFFKWLSSTKSQPVDLSLNISTNQVAPAWNSEVEISYTVENTSANATSLVQVGLVWPAGLVWVGDDSAGSYNPATGIWDADVIPANASKTLKIRARVGTASNYRLDGEIHFAFNQDPDSTPFNRSSHPYEDDTAALMLYPIDKPVNSAPMITSYGGAASANISTPENSQAVTTITAEDADGDAVTYRLGTEVDEHLFQINTNSGKLAFIKPPDYEDPKDSNQDNLYILTVIATDGVNETTQLLFVTVTNVLENSPPKIVSEAGEPGTTLSMLENLQVAATITAEDADGDPIAYSISGGEDAALFQISNSGILSFMVAPDYEKPLDENKDNIYVVIVTANDGFYSVSQTMNIRVSDVFENLAPEINSYSGVAAVNVSTPENKKEAGVVTAIDPNAESLIYSISGGADAALFSINSATGVLDFVTAPDYENPKDSNRDNSYVVVVSATDVGGLSASQTLTIQVTDVDDLPFVNLNLRVFLQGAYSASSKVMRGDLHRLGILPVLQPYGELKTAFGYASSSDMVSPFDYKGKETASAAVLAAEGGNAPVDWVLVEVRDASDPSKRIGVAAGLLQRDGDIVDAKTGTNVLSVWNVIEDAPYYVMVRHRNHLAIMTTAPLTLSRSPTMVDFTLPSTPVYGGSRARLESGDTALMWTGDANNSNTVIANGPGSDSNVLLGAVLVAPENTKVNAAFRLPGYYSTDFNLDGATLYTGPSNDINLMLGNILMHPGNTSFSGNYIIRGNAPI
ncbi:MAG: choice-of-anchor L domain-containing protein [Candidatus Thiothrix putei]|uniref:Choice-of-anchor L domain-containing protein n=1 Tax=Candidatus Thiothrix putei TaxID=3080811 RepID=A0AA95HFZ6_9GAMM|nr:MAG: choice-of-anchor L domain-containing protein [Candidatus Thiothrix putei]